MQIWIPMPELWKIHWCSILLAVPSFLWDCTSNESGHVYLSFRNNSSLQKVTRWEAMANLAKIFIPVRIDSLWLWTKCVSEITLNLESHIECIDVFWSFSKLLSHLIQVPTDEGDSTLLITFLEVKHTDSVRAINGQQTIGFVMLQIPNVCLKICSVLQRWGRSSVLRVMIDRDLTYTKAFV